MSLYNTKVDIVSGTARRNQFLDAFGSTGSMYAGGGYMNYYYDINNLKERLAIR